MTGYKHKTKKGRTINFKSKASFERWQKGIFANAQKRSEKKRKLVAKKLSLQEAKKRRKNYLKKHPRAKSDELRTAKVVYDEPNEYWAQRQGSSDVRGVDTAETGRQTISQELIDEFIDVFELEPEPAKKKKTKAEEKIEEWKKRQEEEEKEEITGTGIFLQPPGGKPKIELLTKKKKEEKKEKNYLERVKEDPRNLQTLSRYKKEIDTYTREEQEELYNEAKNMYRDNFLKPYFTKIELGKKTAPKKPVIKEKVSEIIKKLKGSDDPLLLSSKELNEKLPTKRVSQRKEYISWYNPRTQERDWLNVDETNKEQMLKNAPLGKIIEFREGGSNAWNYSYRYKKTPHGWVLLEEKNNPSQFNRSKSAQTAAVWTKKKSYDYLPLLEE